MTKYAAHYNGQLRLALLRLLAEVPNYQLNSSALNDCMRPLGFNVGRTYLNGQLHWLDESGLVNMENNEFKPDIKIITLTTQGLDVAQGLATFEGVARPSP